MNLRHPPRLDSVSGKTFMPFPCFDLCLTAWRESEIVFHGTVVGAAILDFFATGFFLDVDDLEVDDFLFGVVTVISLMGFIEYEKWRLYELLDWCLLGWCSEMLVAGAWWAGDARC